MLTAAEVAKFHADGYLLGGRVLDDAQVAVLQEEVLRVIAERDDASKPQPVLCHNFGSETSVIWQIVNIWEASEPFRQLIHDARIAEEIAQLTGRSTIRLWHDQIQYKPATTGGVNMWHQDAPYWPICLPMTQVTAWVALDDVDEENGCMSMVPGSHLWGNQIEVLHTLGAFGDMPADWEGHPLRVHTCPVRKGHVHFHHALTWHGSDANRSGRPRRAIALHYMTDETLHVASGDHVMKPFVESADGEPIVGIHFPQVWPANH